MRSGPGRNGPSSRMCSTPGDRSRDHATSHPTGRSGASSTSSQGRFSTRRSGVRISRPCGPVPSGCSEMEGHAGSNQVANTARPIARSASGSTSGRLPCSNRSRNRRSSSAIALAAWPWIAIVAPTGWLSRDHWAREPGPVSMASICSVTWNGIVVRFSVLGIRSDDAGTDPADERSSTTCRTQHHDYKRGSARSVTWEGGRKHLDSRRLRYIMNAHARKNAE